MSEVGSAPSVAGPPVVAVAVRPDPFRHGTSIRLEILVPSQGSVQVRDPDGRLVRTVVVDARLAAGDHTFWWNGRDERGEPVVPGEYAVRVRVGAQEWTETITRAR